MTTGEDDDPPRRPLTFRLDREVRRRLRQQPAGEGRTLTEVVTAGLRGYVERGEAPARPAAAGTNGRESGRPVARNPVATGARRAVATLRELPARGDGDRLSALLAAALGISRQAVHVRARRPAGSWRACPRTGRRPHVTIRIDHRLRAAAHAAAGRDGTSLSQVIDQIVDRYLRHTPTGEIELGDTTPTGPVPRSAHHCARARRHLRRRPGDDG